MNYIKEERDYKRRKVEYMKNKTPEGRYDMIDIHEGFVVRDRLSHENHIYDNDYMLLTNPFGEEREVQEGYKDKDDFINMVNDLDRAANGNLYSYDCCNLLINKQELYKQMEAHLDRILNNLITNDSFKIVYSEFDYDNGHTGDINIDVSVYRPGLKNIGNTPYLERILGNQVFDKVMITINRYQDELEQSKDDFDAAKVDALIELKMRIFEEIHKDPEIKNILNLLRS